MMVVYAPLATYLYTSLRANIRLYVLKYVVTSEQALVSPGWVDAGAWMMEERTPVGSQMTPSPFANVRIYVLIDVITC